MTVSFTVLPARRQEALPLAAYDSWIDPDGDATATFHRAPGRFLVRFPQQADFTIDADSLAVVCTPDEGVDPQVAATLFHNAIQPIIGNHQGELNLHGSAVGIGATAVAFLGMSRRGKTTLAGAFARAGHAFLTEDVVGLESAGQGVVIKPSQPVLRLFHDSAAFLTDGQPGWDDADEKKGVPASVALPFRDEVLPLAGLFILGPGTSDGIVIERLGKAAALAELIPHSFILDVEDRRRLKGHFLRIAALADTVACYSLDYPRTYDHLPMVISSIVGRITLDRGVCETD